MGSKLSGLIEAGRINPKHASLPFLSLGILVNSSTRYKYGLKSLSSLPDTRSTDAGRLKSPSGLDRNKKFLRR
jgi:hypothetical protein